MQQVNDFIILTDTRQKSEAHINQAFDDEGILHIRTGLPSADYMAVRYSPERGFYKDYSVLIDTKKDLLELCGNLCHTSEHRRVVDEINKARELGCKHFIFLIGDSKIKSFDDIANWSNKNTRVKGSTLLKVMRTFKDHHDCTFMIVPRRTLGKTIIKLLSSHNEITMP